MVSVAATSLRAALEQKMKELGEALEGMSEDDAARRPADGEWSCKEMLSHLMGDEGEGFVAGLGGTAKGAVAVAQGYPHRRVPNAGTMGRRDHQLPPDGPHRPDGQGPRSAGQVEGEESHAAPRRALGARGQECGEATELLPQAVRLEGRGRPREDLRHGGYRRRGDHR